MVVQYYTVYLLVVLKIVYLQHIQNNKEKKKSQNKHKDKDKDDDYLSDEDSSQMPTENIPLFVAVRHNCDCQKSKRDS